MLTNVRYVRETVEGKTIDSCNSHRYEEAFQEFLRTSEKISKVVSMIYDIDLTSIAGLGYFEVG